MCVGARSVDGGLSSPKVQRKRVSAAELTGENVSVSGAVPVHGATPPSARVAPASTRAQPVTAKSSASVPGHVGRRPVTGGRVEAAVRRGGPRVARGQREPGEAR